MRTVTREAEGVSKTVDNLPGAAQGLAERRAGDVPRRSGGGGSLWGWTTTRPRYARATPAGGDSGGRLNGPAPGG
jgi:hypothetical protein